MSEAKDLEYQAKNRDRSPVLDGCTPPVARRAAETPIPLPRRAPRCGHVARVALPIGLLAMGLMLVACGEEEDELKGPLGAGEGGTAVTTGSVVTHGFTDADDESIGEFDYDDSVLTTHVHPDPAQPSLHILSTVDEFILLADVADGQLDQLGADDMVIAFTRVVGRPDTPCRVQAALLARDEGYKILASGDRRNDQGLKFHQVNLRNSKIPNAQRFYCAKLEGRLGIQTNVITRDEPAQIYLQVHFVLNSIRPN